ncbi:hypothetical protein BMS3Bbin03_00818 [bacterium BMS3Bbin03]|nr:hypothetical protein BMS3Bbin03_00818 [bacterium BMS3Bbin03]
MISKTAFRGIKIALALLILGALIWTIRPAQIGQAFLTADLSLIILAFILMPVNLYLQIYKWHYMVRWIRPASTFSEAMREFLISLAIGFTTPGRIGEYSRAFFVKKTDWVIAMGVVAVDKIYTMLIVIGIGGWTALLFLSEFPFIATLNGTIKIILELFFTILLISPIFPELFKAWVLKIGGHFPQDHPLHRLIYGLEILNNQRGRKVFLLSFAAYLIFSFQFYILVNAFEKVPVQAGAITIPTVFFIKTILPISIGDLGIREGASVFFFKKFSVSSAAAFNGPILLFVINLLIPGLAGLYFLIKEKHPLRGRS